MRFAKAFSKGRSAAVNLPVEANIKPGDSISLTVLAPGRVLVERNDEIPDYTHFVPKRTTGKPKVTSELVRKLLRRSGL